MAKADYAKDMEIQRLLKENSSLKNRLQTSSEREGSLKDKIEHLENSFNQPGTAPAQAVQTMLLAEIKLTGNIRDQYQYEEIEALAADILNHGQLQPALVSKDNFLLAGYRRYHAVKYLNENRELFAQADGKIPAALVVYKLDLAAADLSAEKIDEIQLAENEQRRSVDNFQLSRLYHKYYEKGYDQAYIAEKFKKSKTLISAVMSLKNIDQPVVDLLKEFQVYAWSKQKFTAVNLQSDTNEEGFYEKNKGIIGWKPLYEIARQDDLNAQKKTFLKLYGSRLSQAERDSAYFTVSGQSENKIDRQKLNAVFKGTKSLANAVKRAGDSLPSEVLQQLSKNLAEIEKILGKITQE